MQKFLEKCFHLKENNTTVNTELTAGLTTFLAMAYILAVNPNILGQAGMPKGGVLFATAGAAFIGTILMAFLSNYPFVLAPGMGLNAYFAFTVVLGMGYSWQYALLAVFIEGLIFLQLSLTKIREAIFVAIPLPLKNAVSAGIGLFITFIALQSAKIVVNNDATLVSILSFSKDSINTSGISAILAMVGVLLIGMMIHFNVKGAILWGMLITWILGMICQAAGIYTVNPAEGYYSLYPSFSVESMSQNYKEAWSLFGALFHPSDWTQTTNGVTVSGYQILFSVHSFIIIFAFLFTDLFDTLGTVVGAASQADMLDKNGGLKNINGVLISDSIATSAGAVLGTSTTTTFVESTAGIACGGRTGLTALTAQVFFLAALVFAPVFLAMPGFATAPALIIVGFYMMSNIKKIDFNNFRDAIPAFITVIMVPFAYSISEGIAMGIISWTILNFLTGNRKSISFLMYILTILFMLKYVLL